MTHARAPRRHRTTPAHPPSPSDPSIPLSPGPSASGDRRQRVLHKTATRGSTHLREEEAAHPPTATGTTEPLLARNMTELEHKPDLWIQVPATPPANGLGPKPARPPAGDPLVEYEKIRELPTPVVNQGLFAYGELDVIKPRDRASRTRLPPRVISDYKPGKLLDRSHLLTQKRVASLPLGQLLRALLLKLVLLIESDDECPYLQLVFEAPTRGTLYRVISQIGRGNFSTVVVAASAIGAMAAIKIISFPLQPDKVANFKSYFIRELNILTAMHHPCIVHLLDYKTNLHFDRDAVTLPTFRLDSQLNLAADSDAADVAAVRANRDQLIFLNYCRGGNLYQFLVHNHPFHLRNPVYWQVLYRIAQELQAAVLYMHSHQVVHRDIKLENVLLNYEYPEMEALAADGFASTPLINVTDFGLLKRLARPDELLLTRCGSTDYVPPEVLMGLEYNGKLTDLWLVGVVLYALLEERLPFDPLPEGADQGMAGVLPLVLRRRRAKNNPSHRIAMIDWQWCKVARYLEDDTFPDEVRTVIERLKHTVEGLLVRKDQREHVSQTVDAAAVPAEFLL